MHHRASLFLFELDLFYVVALRSLLLQCLLYGSSGHLVRARSSVLSVYQRIFGIVGVAALTARRRASRRQHTFQHRPAVVLSGDEKGNGTRDHHQHQHNSRCQLTRTCSVRHGTHTQIHEQCDSRAKSSKTAEWRRTFVALVASVRVQQDGHERADVRPQHAEVDVDSE